MTARAAAAVPFAAAAKLVGEAGRGIALAGRRAGRRAEADGNAAAAVIEAEAAAIATGKITPLLAGPAPDKLYVAIDGTGMPMVTAAVTGRDGKGEDGKARTREVKMAAGSPRPAWIRTAIPSATPAPPPTWPPSPRPRASAC